MEANSSWANESSLAPPLAAECTWEVQQPQHALYQVAHVCLIVSFLGPANKRGLLYMHAMLALGFVLVGAWAWSVACRPRLFAVQLLWAALSGAQALHVLYRARTVRLPPHLDRLYRALFQPFQVSRLTFQKLMSPECCQMMSLHPGEAYAMQGLTKTDRLGLLISGKANVISGRHFLHPIGPHEFLDSPEFESSRAGSEDIFKVSVVSVVRCRCAVWQRTSLEYLLVKEPHLATLLALLLARDIASKLHAMNQKMVTETGSHLDIRLPSLTGSLATAREEEARRKKSGAVLEAKNFIDFPDHSKLRHLSAE